MMKAEDRQTLVPQAEEDIEQCIWVGLDELESYYENTHPSIIDVLQSGIKRLRTRKDR
jgi:hypothetical protein